MEIEATTVIFVLLALVLILLGSLLAVVVYLRNLKRELNRFTKSIDKLETRLENQERKLEEIKSVVSQRKDDPITAVIEAVKKWRTKGLVPALTLLGTQLFRAYLGKKRRKSLPSPDDLE